MSKIHLVHVPLGSLIHTGDGQAGVVLHATPGKRILEFPYRADETADTPGKARTYRQIADLYDLVELVKTPTQLAQDAALTMYDEQERVDEGKLMLFPLVGEMIKIPAWQVTGMVQKVSKAIIGSDQAVTVLLQQHPDDPARAWKVYHLEPGECEVC